MKIPEPTLKRAMIVFNAIQGPNGAAFLQLLEDEFDGDTYKAGDQTATLIRTGERRAFLFIKDLYRLAQGQAGGSINV